MKIKTKYKKKDGEQKESNRMTLVLDGPEIVMFRQIIRKASEVQYHTEEQKLFRQIMDHLTGQ